MSEKLKDSLWWIGMIIYSALMLVFTIKGAVPAWFVTGSVTAIAIFRLIIGKPWELPEHPPAEERAPPE